MLKILDNSLIKMFISTWKTDRIKCQRCIMDREAYIKLIEWNNKAKRKPLILNGARQVGKTWLLKEFGTREYDSMAYINCDENTDIKDVFYDFDPKRSACSVLRSIKAMIKRFKICQNEY